MFGCWQMICFHKKKITNNDTLLFQWLENEITQVQVGNYIDWIERPLNFFVAKQLSINQLLILCTDIFAGEVKKQR